MEDNKSYTIENNTIVIHRGLTELDTFLKEFLGVIKNYTDYLVVSGYVSISTGRTRATEDIDILFPIILKEEFYNMFNKLKENNFWCYQGDDPDEAFNYIKDFISIRFAKKDRIFPNIEFIPIDKSKKAKYFEFNNPQEILIKNNQELQFKIPPIEFEILYKEIILAGKKDIEDAAHLREFFSEILKPEKFREYKPIIEEELK
ncbi:hypothetical protein CMI42_02440 [Candidatus Pacearchaeota archaeon]|nr:hypothetical protein [Candidatus Pacearchaeota archaeon]|tara:strand:+ start:663 stop:1271 length:609 start_codon:yes stop_codon:yes gene_type:complete